MPAAPGEPEAAEAPPPIALPLLRDLPSNQRERNEARPVEGCTGECPCRRRARDYDGKTVVEICMDPYGRLQRLKAAQIRNRNKVARAGFKQLAGRLSAQLGALQAIGPRELALLAAKTIEHGTWRSSKQLDPAIRRWLPAAAPAVDRPSSRPSAGALYRFDELEVVRLAIAVLLETEIGSAIEVGHGGSVDMTRWYLDELPACPDEGGDDRPALINMLELEPPADTTDGQVREA